MASNPKYINPPVVETVLGVQFPELEGFRGAHVGLFWQTLQDKYPHVTDQPRIEPAQAERFPRIPPIPGSQFQLVQGMPLHRTWFTAKSESELIQLQPDRFLFNWRRREGDYPSYETNKEEFFKGFDAFCKFCQETKGISEPKPEMCEVTYINHIDPNPEETAIDIAGRVFSGMKWETTDGFLSAPDGLTFNRSFVINELDKPMGRLYAEASIAVRREDGRLHEFVLFKLTSRVNYKSDQGQKLTDSMQLAHDWVVRGFADLTNKQFQKERWGRQT